MYINHQQYLRTICKAHKDIKDARYDDYATREDVSAALITYPAALIETPYLEIEGDADNKRNVWVCAIAFLLHTTSDDTDRILHNKVKAYVIARDVLKLIDEQHEKGQNNGYNAKRVRLEEIPQQHGDNQHGWRLEIPMYDCEKIDITDKFDTSNYIPLSFNYNEANVILSTEANYKLYVDGQLSETDNDTEVGIPQEGDIYLEIKTNDGQVASARWTAPSSGSSHPYHYYPYS